MKAQKWSTGVTLLFIEPRNYMGMAIQGHPQAALPPGKRAVIS